MASALFSWLTIEPAAVIRAAQLEAHEVDRDLTQADFEADAATLLDEVAGDVKLAIQDAAQDLSWPFSVAQWTSALPDETQSQRDARRALQTAQANTVCKTLAAAALRQRNGGDDNLNVGRALTDGRGENVTGAARLGSAEAMLNRLIADVGKIAVSIREAAAPASGARVGAILMGIGD